MIVYTSDTTEV